MNILINIISDKTKEILKRDKCIIDGKFTEYKRYILENYKEFENIVNTQDFIYLIKKHLYKNYSFFYDSITKRKIFFDKNTTCKYLLTHNIKETIYNYGNKIIYLLIRLEQNKNIKVLELKENYIYIKYKNKKIKINLLKTDKKNYFGYIATDEEIKHLYYKNSEKRIINYKETIHILNKKLKAVGYGYRNIFKN